MATLYEVLDNLGGALRIAGNLILQPITRAHYRYWGATNTDRQRTLPGDERVPNPQITTTLSITIDAPASAIWPWLAQLGQERGGMYSYELLENLARCQMRMGPSGYPVNQVIALERNRWLLMAGANLKTGIADPLPQPGQTTYINYTWLLYLDEQADGTTRLISRTHLGYAPRPFAAKLMWEVFTDPIGCIMTHKMLLTIKQRAGQTHQQPMMRTAA